MVASSQSRVLARHVICAYLASSLQGAVHGFSTTISRQQTRVPKSTEEIRLIQHEIEQQAREKHNEEAWNALFVSVPERSVPSPCETPMKPLPNDFPPGCLLRLGPNGGPTSDGFLDGDGMVQCITFPPNDSDKKHMFSSTYIETEGRKLEAQNKKRFEGSLGGAPQGFPLVSSLIRNAVAFKTLQAQKDTCNTALAEHGGRVLALMEQCPPTEISVDKNGSVETLQSMSRLDGAVPKSDPITGGSFSAHGRTCPDTGERIHVSYSSSEAPFARVNVFEGASGWNLKKTMNVNVPVPVMIHDSVITKNHVVILDFPLTIRPSRMLFNSFPVEYEPEHGARIGLVPRHGSEGETENITWFDCKPGVVLHAANAYETSDNKVIVHALRSEPRKEESYLTKYTTAFLYEWVLDTVTGELVSETCLNPHTLADFPVIDSRFVGKEPEHVYALSVGSIGGPLRLYKAPDEGVLFDGFIKFAMTDNEEAGVKKGDMVDKYTISENWYPVSEPTIVGKKNPDGSDKEGSYLVFLESHVPEEVPSWEEIEQDNVLRSRVVLLDTENLGAGPVWTMDLPYHVPYGLHSHFLEWDKLK